MLSKRLFSAALLSAVFLPVVACTDDIVDPAGGLCCTEFKVGADLSGADFGVDASIKGEFEVLAQGAADFSATATGMLDDVTNACKAIAQDLGASAEDREKAEAKTGAQEKVAAWCELAVGALDAAGAASGSIDIDPPSISCEASVSAKANCQAKCSASAECDVEANPPKCTGGTMQLSCEGSCKATAKTPSFSCKGSCSVAAKGSCTAQGGVDCQGKCEGECEGSTDSGGNCEGTCKGTCSVVKPGAKCEGSFEGECKGECEATPGSATVECSAGCEGKATPLKCEGGKLEGGCEVDAKCDANCDASVSAKADCNVKPLRITAKGKANLKIDAAIATLQVNLPKLLVAVKARGEAMGDIATNFVGAGTADLVANPGKLGVKGGACALAIVGVLTSAAGNVKASIEAGASVTGQVGL